MTDEFFLRLRSNPHHFVQIAPGRDGYLQGQIPFLQVGQKHASQLGKSQYGQRKNPHHSSQNPGTPCHRFFQKEGIPLAQSVKETLGFVFVRFGAQNQGHQRRHIGGTQNQGSYQRKNHGLGHRFEHFPLNAAEG